MMHMASSFYPTVQPNQYALHRISNQDMARMRAKEHLRWIEGKPIDDFCRICEKQFQGSFLRHRKGQEHRRKERLMKRGCRLCQTGHFSQYSDYVKHVDSNMHKRRKGELQHLQQELQDSFVDEEHVIKECHSNRNQMMVDGNQTRFVDRHITGECGNNSSDSISSVSEDDNDRLSPSDYTDDGSEFISTAQAFFCQLCEQFFLSDMETKAMHCNSLQHTEKYKAKMLSQEISQMNSHLRESGRTDSRESKSIQTDSQASFNHRNAVHSSYEHISPMLNAAMRMEVELIVRPPPGLGIDFTHYT